MKNKIIFYIEESLDGGYEAQALGYSIFTEGDSINELKIMDMLYCNTEVS